MAHGKGKKFLVGLLAVIIVVAGGLAAYTYMFGTKHKTEYGAKHKITKKEASLVERFEEQLKKCSKDVFTHAKLPYKPPKGAEADGYKRATGVVAKEIRVCLQGQKTADGKGFSPPNMQGKQLEPLASAKSCTEFADKFVSLVACETRIEALIDDAGFIDPEDADAAKRKKGGMAAKPEDDMAVQPKDDMAVQPKGDTAAKPKKGAMK